MPRLRLQGTATVFWLGDGMSGSHFACARAAKALFGSHRLRNDAMAVAIRAPGKLCGQSVVVENVANGERVRADVLDAGPFGQDKPDGSYYVGLELCEGCKWRAAIDLLPPVAAAIHLDGRGRVRVYW